MTQIQIALVLKWRGQICGNRITFPTNWHKTMYQKEKQGNLPSFRKVTKSLNFNFG